jgi:hypothetical protein
MRVRLISITIIFFTLCTYHRLEAQSAVYVCAKTGRYGIASDDGNAPRMSLEQTKKEAKKRCIDQGGEECILFYSDETKGWYTLFTGGEKEKYIFAIGKSIQSEKESMKKAIDDFLKKGGIIQPSCGTSSWYVPKDAVGYKNKHLK